MVTSKNKPAFLFPGQGSQYPGMALDLREKSPAVQKLFALAAEVFGRDMRQLLAAADSETLKRTDIAQMAVTLANLSAAAFLKEQDVMPAACAGHSLGEYAALETAGVLSAEAALALVKARGEIMNRNVPPDTGMAAVLGLEGAQVEALVLAWRTAGLSGLYAANFNAPRQTVVSGTRDALARAEPLFKEAGAKRFVPLAVAGAFHSPFMAGAAEEFEAVLEKTFFSAPKLPLFSNVTGGLVRSGAEAASLAVAQITSPVRWTLLEAEIAWLGASGAVDAVVEAGPGKTLCGLWKDTGSPLPAYPCGKLNGL
jgi:[acyl-carrier-protein] S-malonyltransferase